MVNIRYPTNREYYKALYRYGSYKGLKVEEGKIFKVYIPDIPVLRGTSYTILLDNSGSEFNVVVSYILIESNGRAKVRVLRDVNVASYGTEIQPIPIAETDGASTKVKVYSGATISGGTVIDGGRIQSSMGVKGIGGEQEFFIGEVVRAHKNMAIVVYNDDTTDIEVDIKIVFHEEL